ncbi:hypothetical protein HU200_048299 [Digitaria exilis]|uniref:Uncharacterized protein n=1 Tax=Digitaria exilis TaxID=1010633 RepID=A0A835EB43_9POAL|nr:hypothetical protein HU200_048299 [Digitaria exilis]
MRCVARGSSGEGRGGEGKGHAAQAAAAAAARWGVDHVLRLHVEHEHHTAARLGKGSVDASRAVIALAAVAMFLAAAGTLLATPKAALFVLSNAIILALLAADCRCFFFAAAGAPATSDADAVDACGEQPGASGHVLAKQERHHQQCAVQPLCYLLQHGNKNSCAASEASTTEPAMALPSDGTTTLQALEEQDDVPPASRPELLLGLPDEGESIALELEDPAVVQEPTCKTVVPGLDELGIDELNKKFVEFIQSRRNKWMKEEAYLQLQS